MRKRTTPLALVAAATLLAAGITTPASAIITDPIDLWAGLDWREPGEDPMPREFEALDVTVGEGLELGADDESANPSGFCGDIAVDVVPQYQIVVVSNDDVMCNFTHVDVRIDAPQIASLVLLQDTFGDEGGEDRAQLASTVGADGIHLSWTATQGLAGEDEEGVPYTDDFNTTGQAIFGYQTGNPFVDVAATSPFAWYTWYLAQSGVTTGYADGSFRPTSPVTRQAMAAFLYRTAGEPEFTAPAVSPFDDVATTAPFYKEISWLAEEGISEGTTVGDTVLFRPSAAVSRQAMAAFLFRFAGAEGEYVAPEESPFVDVPTSSDFYTEIAFLAEYGIATGTVTPGGAFYKPTDAVSRQAMAAFLFRFQIAGESSAASFVEEDLSGATVTGRNG